MRNKKAKAIRKGVYGDYSHRIKEYDEGKIHIKKVPLFKKQNPWLIKIKKMLNPINYNKPIKDEKGGQKFQKTVFGQLVCVGRRKEYQEAKKGVKGVPFNY